MPWEYDVPSELEEGNTHVVKVIKTVLHFRFTHFLTENTIINGRCDKDFFHKALFIFKFETTFDGLHYSCIPLQTKISGSFSQQNVVEKTNSNSLKYGAVFCTFQHIIHAVS